MADAAIIVFGGSGFIGSHLFRHPPTTYAGRLISAAIRPPKARNDRVTYVEADVRDLSGFLVEGPVATLYNLAAPPTTPGCPTHAYHETNVAEATQITALARRIRCRDIVLTSPVSVYGPSEQTTTEARPPMPESAYGWSKRLAEGIHRAWPDYAEDWRPMSARLAVTFGESEGSAFTRLAALRKKGLFVFPGCCGTIKACLHIEGLLEPVARAKALDQRYILFNGSYPDWYKIEEIVPFRQAHFRQARTVTVTHAALMTAATLARQMAALAAKSAEVFFEIVVWMSRRWLVFAHSIVRPVRHVPTGNHARRSTAEAGGMPC